MIYNKDNIVSVSYTISIGIDGNIYAMDNNDNIKFEGNSSEVINNAIDSLEIGGKISIENGIYDTSSNPIFINNNKIILDMSRGAILQPSNGEKDIIILDASDCILDGINTNGKNGGGWAINVGKADNAQNNIIYNCNLIESRIGAIRLSINSGVCNVYANRIQNNLIGSSDGGIVIADSADHIISSNDIGGFGKSGIISSGGSNNRIIDNQIYVNTEHGIDVYLSKYLNIIGNNIMSNHKHGIFVHADYEGKWHSIIISENNIHDNSIDNTGIFDGINLDSNNVIFDISIIGNVCTDLQDIKTQNYGITISSDNIQNCIICNNIVTNNKTGGIDLVAVGKGLIVKDNKGFNPQSVVKITLGKSPFYYMNNDGYQETITITGGIVSDISIIRNFITTSLGSVCNSVLLYPDDVLRVNYTKTPIMIKIPC